MTPAVSRQPAFVASGRPVFRPRNGWLEVVVTPRRLRYLRLEPAEPVGEAPWGITELRVYEEIAEPPAAPARVDGRDGLVARLRAQGVSRLLADPVASARVARATQGAVTTLIANGVVDNHGAAPPVWLARPVRLRASRRTARAGGGCAGAQGAPGGGRRRALRGAPRDSRAVPDPQAVRLGRALSAPGASRGRRGPRRWRPPRPGGGASRRDAGLGSQVSAPGAGAGTHDPGRDSFRTMAGPGGPPTGRVRFRTGDGPAAPSSPSRMVPWRSSSIPPAPATCGSR